MTKTIPKDLLDFKVFLKKLDEEKVKGQLGVKPDSFYKPYSKEANQHSGISARALCSLLFQAKSALVRRSNSSSDDVINEVENLIDYIIENQKDGFLDYSKQEELAYIYEKLGSIKESAQSLEKTQEFNAAQLFQAIKRFYWPQVGEYLAGYAHENAKELPPMLAGASNSTMTSAELSFGRVLNLGPLGGARIAGSIEFSNLKQELCRHDDHVNFTSTENGGTLKGAATFGVVPAIGVAAPTGTISGSALNLAGAGVNAGAGLFFRDGVRTKPTNVGPVKVESKYVNGGKNGNSSRSSKFFKWCARRLTGAKLEEFGIHDNTFNGPDGEKNKITAEEFEEILTKNGIDTSNAEHSSIKFRTAEEKRAEYSSNFTKFVENNNDLTPNKRNSIVSIISSRANVSANASVLEYAKAQAYAQIGYDVTKIVFCSGDIDIAKTELAAVKKSNPQHAFTNAKNIIKTLEKEKGFTDAFEVLKDIKRITTQIHRGEHHTKQISDLFSKLGDMGLISAADLNNQKLRKHLCGDADQLKAYIMLAYINFLAGAYDLVKDSKPPDELTKLNKYYSGIANFIADGLWTGPTPAHTVAKEKYHQKVFALEPKESATSLTTSFGANAGVGFTVGSKQSADGRKHAFTNMIVADVKVTRTSVDNHPALNRNKTDLTLDITLSGVVIDAATLTKQLIDRLTKEPGLENKAEAMARSAVRGLLSLHNAASDIDKITGKTGLPISPFSFAGTQPYGALNLQVVYNSTAKEIDFVGLSSTNTIGLGFDTASVTQWVEAPLPVFASAKVGRYHSEREMLAWRFSGTTSTIGLLREVCDNLREQIHFDKNELVPFLQKLKKNRQLPGLMELGQVALDNKIKASAKVPEGAFDELANKSGAECIKQNKLFKEIFAKANITEAQVEEYKAAIAKLHQSEDIKEAADKLTASEWLSIKDVLAVWKSANDVYTKMDKAYKDHIELALHAQPDVDLINKLQGQANKEKAPSITHSIQR